MNIYELTGYALQLKELLDSDEIDEQTFSDTLEGIGADDKVDSYCMIIRELESEIGAREAEARRLAELNEKAKKSIERMKGALAGFVSATGKPKIHTPLFTVSYRRSEAVEVFDESLIPEDYIKISVKKAPDKTAIKAILKSGGEVAGCVLRENRNLQIK